MSPSGSLALAVNVTVPSAATRVTVTVWKIAGGPEPTEEEATMQTAPAVVVDYRAFIESKIVLAACPKWFFRRAMVAAYASRGLVANDV